MYDFKNKCVKLLDDGRYAGDPLKRHYFGVQPELLFEPCSEDALECFITEDGRSFRVNPLIPLPPAPAPPVHASRGDQADQAGLTDMLAVAGPQGDPYNA